MNESILIITCGDGGQPDPRVDLLIGSLRGKGMPVQQVDLEGNHRMILDRLEQGERPFVIKRRL